MRDRNINSWDRLYFSTYNHGYRKLREFLTNYSKLSQHHKIIADAYRKMPDESLLIYEDIITRKRIIDADQKRRYNQMLVELYRNTEDKNYFWVKFTENGIYENEMFDGLLFEHVDKCSHCGIVAHGIIMNYKLTNGLCPECQNHNS